MLGLLCRVNYNAELIVEHACSKYTSNTIVPTYPLCVILLPVGTRMCVRTNTYIHTGWYIHTYIHTYIHAYIHACC
eukprot:COSAG05_NODE_2254_length_3334_cov_1.702009_3_plen_76_part_00